MRSMERRQARLVYRMLIFTIDFSPLDNIQEGPCCHGLCSAPALGRKSSAEHIARALTGIIERQYMLSKQAHNPVTQQY